MFMDLPEYGPMTSTDAARPLSGHPDVAIGLALGMAINHRSETSHPGALAMIIDELTIRHLMPEIVTALGVEAARALMLRVGVDRSRARRAQAGVMEVSC